MAVSAALVDGPGTCRELAQRAGLGVTETRYALRNMVRAGDARTGVPKRVPGVCRWVPVYHRSVRSGDAAIGVGVELGSLLASWLAPAAAAHQMREAAM